MRPRILADDLQIISTGTRHLDHFKFAFTKTHEHLEDMGAKVAPSKRVVFSTNSGSRECLKKHVWRRLKRNVKVVNNGRDLGAHFNISDVARYGATLTDRMVQATGGAERLDRHKAPYEKKKGENRKSQNPAKGTLRLRTCPGQ